MDLTIILNNIDRYLRTNDTTDNALSKQAGRADAIRNLRRYATGELKGTWTLDTLEAVAHAMGVPSWELLKPPSTVSLNGDVQDMVRALIREELAAPKAPKAPKARRASR